MITKSLLSDVAPVRWQTTSTRTNIRIAVQKSGRLKDASMALLSDRGIAPNQSDNDRALIVACPGNIEIVFVRHSDIPNYVQSGAADFGIVGENVLYEQDSAVAVQEKLGFGACEVMVAAPDGSPIRQLADLNGTRIATSYPNSLRKKLRDNDIDATIIQIGGAVEAAPALGLADAICDVTQTGSTLKANGLRKIGTLLRSEAVIIAGDNVGPASFIWGAS
ncbi:MAG: ATP phosphoribosyltransferase [Corynebacteriales bacterium]|nr:ATP phosphoribosyltransferase [Mycobacteriales bacterium]